MNTLAQELTEKIVPTLPQSEQRQVFDLNDAAPAPTPAPTPTFQPLDLNVQIPDVYLAVLGGQIGNHYSHQECDALMKNMGITVVSSTPWETVTEFTGNDHPWAKRGLTKNGQISQDQNLRLQGKVSFHHYFGNSLQRKRHIISHYLGLVDARLVHHIIRQCAGVHAKLQRFDRNLKRS